MMYSETGLLFSYYHTFPQEIQQLQDLPCIPRPSVSAEESTSTLPDYEFGVEGDLFKASEQIIGDHEPLISLDPTVAAEISVISFGGEVIDTQDLEVQDIESSFDFGKLLSEVFYECKKDIIVAKEEEEEEEARKQISDDVHDSQGLVRKSASTGCLRSMEKITETSSVDLHGTDLDVVNRMRRAFSEGDLKILGNGSSSIHCKSAAEQHQITINYTSEDRMEKLLRYRNKKAKRNFGRKIKYACRKALADNQPRIRGRFAKTGH